MGVLTGAAVVTVDLARRLPMPVELDFISVASYGDQAVSSGKLRWDKDLSRDIAGRDVILVEDIIDTGYTLHRVRDALLARAPRSLALCALLDKPEQRRVDVPVAYIGCAIPNAFVVGYGLDHAQRFRNLPYVAVLRPEVYTAT